MVQTRHRIPEQPLRADQTIVFQVPLPEPLRFVERNEAETRRMHGEMDYSRAWVALYEDIVHSGTITRGGRVSCARQWAAYFQPQPDPAVGFAEAASRAVTLAVWRGA